MSLINKMLQDLESRRADNAAIPNDVRSLPVERRAPWTRISSGIIVTGIMVAGVILWLRAHEQESLVVAAVPTVRPSVSNTPVATGSITNTTTSTVAAPTSPLAIPPSNTSAGSENTGSTNAQTQSAAIPAPTQMATATLPTLSPVAVASSPTPAPPTPVLRPTKSNTATPFTESRLKVATALSIPQGVAESSAPPTNPTNTAPRAAETGASSIDKQLRNSSPSERAESDYRKATGLLNQGRVNESIVVFRAALQEDPKYLTARLALLGVLTEQKRLDEAQVLLQEGLAVNPAQHSLALRLARLQTDRGDLRGAAETLHKFAASAHASAEYRGFYAGVLQRLNRNKEAIEEYQATLRLAPHVGVWWMGLGLSLESESRGAEAREAFLKARASGALSPELDRFVEQKLK